MGISMPDTSFFIAYSILSALTVEKKCGIIKKTQETGGNSMLHFPKKHTHEPLPEGFTEQDIRVESSTCTGERTIGFYDRGQKMLIRAELVRSAADIAAFYRRYGLTPPEKR